MCMNMNRQHWCIQHEEVGGVGGGEEGGGRKDCISGVFSTEIGGGGWGGEKDCPSGVFSVRGGGV